MGCGCGNKPTQTPMVQPSTPATQTYADRYQYFTARQLENMPKAWCVGCGGKMCPVIIYNKCKKREGQ